MKCSRLNVCVGHSVLAARSSRATGSVQKRGKLGKVPLKGAICDHLFRSSPTHCGRTLRGAKRESIICIFPNQEENKEFGGIFIAAC